MQIEISDAILAGVGAVVENAMSLGGSGGFAKKAATGLALYAPVGALVGGVTTALDARRWGIAIPAVYRSSM